jgi:hypothetical protein
MKYITKKQLSEKLEPINLKALIAQETNGRMRIRLLALLHIKDGADRTQAAKHVKVSRKVVNDWAKKFFNEGLEGLNEKQDQDAGLNLPKINYPSLKSMFNGIV